ncbi:hypothetical protein INS90_01820 [Trueperella pecoris]|uniref:Exonuclease domain-containing protein n=1 Tax=Trueperella pecoris TaxID=2733571 RepID=A0A7M1R1A1_9ACTO|nr:exonuclease domain-containing protein [Trueperella pecoris]QOR48060.1 hypothetical protein INS90_01820 [Trueperella pecoris]
MSNPDLYATGGYAVVDFETTGLSFNRGDRVLEVGVVKLDAAGNIVDTFETLVNPMRHVGATHIHGITASDVMAAPLFGDIADHLAAILEGTVFVAHNASFDARFARDELAATGNFLGAKIPYLDTMALARHYGVGKSAKLSDVSQALGIRNSHAHSALADAIATAQVLEYFLHQTPAVQERSWRAAIDATRNCTHYRYCTLADDPKRITRADAARARDALRNGTWVRQAVGGRDIPDDFVVAQYFHLLDDVFLDRELSLSEQQRLLSFAAHNDLSNAALTKIHESYLRFLIDAAWADGVLTPEEQSTIEIVGKYLGTPVGTLTGRAVSPSTSNRASATALGQDSEATPSAPAHAHLFESKIVLNPGDRVTVTGPVLHGHEEWERFFAGHGVGVAGLAKCTKVLIAGDTNSMSSKARKARAYGIPVISEPAVADSVTFA